MSRWLGRLLAWLSPALCARCGQAWSAGPDTGATGACPCCGYAGRQGRR